jgi:hypothetical protein
MRVMVAICAIRSGSVVFIRRKYLLTHIPMQQKKRIYKIFSDFEEICPAPNAGVPHDWKLIRLRCRANLVAHCSPGPTFDETPAARCRHFVAAAQALSGVRSATGSCSRVRWSVFGHLETHAPPLPGSTASGNPL